MGYIKTVGIALDQLGMAICGGNEDCTISATTGYYSRNNPSNFWILLEWIINTTFYPVDGEGHCRQALEKNKAEEFRRGYKLPLAVVTISSCLIIGLLLWGIYGLKTIGKKA